MQQNISTYERLASVTIGAFAATRGMTLRADGSKNLLESLIGLGLLWRGVSGHCPIYQGLERQTKAKVQGEAERIVKSVVVNRPMDYVRDILGENDPEWLASASKKAQIKLGDHLWELRLSEVHGRKATLVKASMAEDEIKKHKLKFMFGTKGRQLKEQLDADLRQFKSAIESDPLFAVDA